MALNRDLLLTLPLAAIVAACSPDFSPNTYNAAAVQQANKVEQGVVVGVRPVDVKVAGTTGAVAGGAAGGIAGSQLPGSSATQALGAVGGGLLGGLIGTGVERAAGDTKAFEYIVRKPNNEMVSVTQVDATPLALGQRVLVIAGSQARIVPDYTTAPPEAPKPAVVLEAPKPPAVAVPAPPAAVEGAAPAPAPTDKATITATPLPPATPAATPQPLPTTPPAAPTSLAPPATVATPEAPPAPPKPAPATPATP